MRKALVVIGSIAVVVALVVWVASWFRAPEAVAASAAQPWPDGLGTLEAARNRFPPIAANDAAKKLTALAQSLPKNDAIAVYVANEIARGELAIGNPPPLPDVTAMRDLLLRDNVVWERRQRGVGDADTTHVRALQMIAARALVAAALAKAHANDAAAWDDLHAVWNLARSFDPQPEVMQRTATIAMARMINAVAWKMPLPAPAWLADVQSRDYVRPLLESFQYQTASYWKSGAEMFPTKWLADSVEHDRRIAEMLSRDTRCDLAAPANDLGVDLSAIWRRTFRVRAELEASANALRIREGKAIETSSRCSDGAWSFDRTTLRFSRAIPLPPPGRPMPLELHVARIERLVTARRSG